MSTRRAMPGGRADKSALSKGPGGRNRCRWCALEVPAGRFTFCSDFCVEEWKLRTNPAHLRERVFQRDHGICAICNVNCQSAMLHMKKSRGKARLKLAKEWGVSASRKSLWDADHVVPVVEGGGQCDLANMRTLCIRCHRTQTAALRQRLKTRLPG